MRRLDSLLLAGVGVLVVHQVAYSISTLAGYGNSVAHGHLAIAWMAGSLAALFALVRAVTRSLRCRNHQIGSNKGLTVVITSGYALLEGLERIADGLSLASLLSEPVFWLGLLLAPLLAVGLNWSLRSVARLAVLVGRRNIGLDYSPEPSCTLPATALFGPIPTTSLTIVSLRGPPVVLHA